MAFSKLVVLGLLALQSVNVFALEAAPLKFSAEFDENIHKDLLSGRYSLKCGHASKLHVTLQNVGERPVNVKKITGTSTWGGETKEITENEYPNVIYPGETQTIDYIFTENMEGTITKFPTKIGLHLKAYFEVDGRETEPIVIYHKTIRLMEGDPRPPPSPTDDEADNPPPSAPAPNSDDYYNYNSAPAPNHDDYCNYNSAPAPSYNHNHDRPYYMGR